MSNPSLTPQSLAVNPFFWLGVVHGADIATQEGSEDFTIGHKVAAGIAKLFGWQVISTPTVADKVPVVQALADGVKVAGQDLASVIAPAVSAAVQSAVK